MHVLVLTYRYLMKDNIKKSLVLWEFKRVSIFFNSFVLLHFQKNEVLILFCIDTVT